MKAAGWFLSYCNSYNSQLEDDDLKLETTNVLTIFVKLCDKSGDGKIELKEINMFFETFFDNP